MQYCSTRDSALRFSASEAIISGLAPDGGLLLPLSCPHLELSEILKLTELDYAGRAAAVMAPFLTDYSAEELLGYTQRAYVRFPAPIATPVVPIGNNTYILELFHGPTCAFKDVALQLLPLLLTAALKKNGINEEVMILVATSGDTGTAALNGFADVNGTKICVFYPDGGTSRIQRLQMTKQAGANLMVAGVAGNFDDAQNGVKRIFSDKAYGTTLKEKGVLLSSANSINWGRLAPQIAYYVSAYCDLVQNGQYKAGEPINIVVPTGNFGDILAAWYAKHMGLPVGRLICASNRNNVLTDFIHTGVYDCDRPFYLTTSPSMDIRISSNLERLLYALCGRDDEKLKAYMAALKAEGEYAIDPNMLAALQREFSCGCADDGEAAASIARVFRERGYLADPHTAVGLKVAAEYREKSGDTRPLVIAATASPYKFPGSVLKALGEPLLADEFAMIARLEALSGTKAPDSLAGLSNKEERFKDVVQRADMAAVVNSMLG